MSITDAFERFEIKKFFLFSYMLSDYQNDVYKTVQYTI